MFDGSEYRPRGVMPIVIKNARGRTREQLNAFFDGADDVHMKLPTGNGIDDVGAQHQGHLIRRRNEHALLSGQTFRGT